MPVEPMLVSTNLAGIVFVIPCSLRGKEVDERRELVTKRNLQAAAMSNMYAVRQRGAEKWKGKGEGKPERSPMHASSRNTTRATTRPGNHSANQPHSTAYRARCAKPRRRFPAEILTSDEVAALLAVCSQGDVQPSPTSLRNRALIALLYRTGLRISEALGLHEKDLDLVRGAIRVLHGKGNRARTIGIDSAGTEHLQRWLTTRAHLLEHCQVVIGASRSLDQSHIVQPTRSNVQHGIRCHATRHRVHDDAHSDARSYIRHAPIFCVIQGPSVGSALEPSYIRVLLKRLAATAGILKRVHPHGLRHTFAAELRQEHFDIGIISKQLGHADISTTARYLDHVAPWSVVEMVRSRGI